LIDDMEMLIFTGMLFRLRTSVGTFSDAYYYSMSCSHFICNM